jgi:hypothetical protein
LKALQVASQRQHESDVESLYAGAQTRFVWIVAGALLIGIVAA